MAVVGLAVLVGAGPAYAHPVRYEPTAAVTGSTIRLTFSHPAYRCAGDRDPAEISVDLVGEAQDPSHAHAHAQPGLGTMLSIPIDAVAIDCAGQSAWTATIDLAPWAARAHVAPGRYRVLVMWGPRSGYAFEADADVDLGAAAPAKEPALSMSSHIHADDGIRWWKIIAFIAFDVVVVAIVLVVRRRRARRAR